MHRFLQPKETLIVGAGERPSLALLHAYRQQARTVIALDGACSFLLEHAIVPDLVIGDLDSAPAEQLHRVPVLCCLDQNSNDLEKAFSYCREQKLTNISVLGAFGLRADHFLTNLYVMKKFSSHLDIIFADDHQCCFIVPNGTSLDYSLPMGSYVSFFPLDHDVGPIESIGVEYPLAQEMLSLSSRIGTLNRVSSKRASIKCMSGSLVMFVPNVYKP